MTPEERELIAGLFERMRSMGAIDKDREAEDFIARSTRQVPDAAYMLVQSVLVRSTRCKRPAGGSRSWRTACASWSGAGLLRPALETGASWAAFSAGARRKSAARERAGHRLARIACRDA